METTKQANQVGNSIVKQLIYVASISVADPKDKDLFDKCLQWRQIKEEQDKEKERIRLEQEEIDKRFNKENGIQSRMTVSYEKSKDGKLNPKVLQHAQTEDNVVARHSVPV